jgi:hypothetical protein
MRMNASTAEQTFERTLSVTRPASIDLNLDSAIVRVSAGETDAIRIRGILRARRSLLGWGSSEDRMHQIASNPPIEFGGNAVRIDGRDLHEVTLLLDIVVPADTRVHARADSGDIRVEGVAAPVACQTDSGTIEIGNIEAGVRASSDSGRIQICGVRGAVFAEADSGSIDALDVSGPVEASADSGAIRISQATAAPVRARADSGSIDVKLAPESGYNIRVVTDKGPVTLPALTFQRTRSRHETEGQVLGGGPMVDIKTDSGGIDIR